VTESVFSMDGDIAPISALAAACKDHGAALVVDEAHALGALGPGGQGICALERVTPDLRIGTLGKAFGTAGGILLGSEIMRSYIVNRARTFIFTTGLPPSIAASTLAALSIIRSAQGDDLRGLLSLRIQQLHKGIGAPGPLTPICPLILGADAVAIEASTKLRERGFFVQAIRPPTVPEGTARLRITLSAQHSSTEVEDLLGCLRSLGLLVP
jgi:8-amino-7-oxononanoate synthase